MLILFRDTIPEKRAELEDLYNTENWKDYTIKIHALKSSARLVGAKELADEALDLEQAGKETRIDHIREHHAEVMSHLSAYIRPLEGLAESEETPLNGE